MFLFSIVYFIFIVDEQNLAEIKRSVKELHADILCLMALPIESCPSRL